MINGRPTFTAADFHKSTYSDPDQDCVHVARRASWVEVRDTKTVFGAPNDHHLTFTAGQFDSLIAMTTS